MERPIPGEAPTGRGPLAARAERALAPPMTEHSGLLLACAQIAVALAGFSGVVAAFSKFRLHPAATAFRVRLMVAASLSTVLFSLAPFVPMLFGAGEQASWRICSAVMALGGAAFPFWAVRSARRLYKAGILHTQPVTIVTNIIGGALTIALFASAAGLIEGRQAAIYVAALYFTLTLCAYYFLMQMFAIDLGKDD